MARPSRIIGALIAGALWLMDSEAPAEVPVATQTKVASYVDRRVAGRVRPRLSDGARRQGEKLERLAPGTTVSVDPVLGTPSLRRNTGMLTPPGGVGPTLKAVTLARHPVGDPHRFTRAFLDEHRELFGFGSEHLAGTVVARDRVAGTTGLRSTVWQQELDGLPVYESVLISHVTRAGALVTLQSRLVSDPQAASRRGHPGRAAGSVRPQLDAIAATLVAARELEETIPPGGVRCLDGGHATNRLCRLSVTRLPGETVARLVWLPLDAGTLRLAWEVELTRSREGERHRVVVDATTGEVWLRRSLTMDLSDATYRVYTRNSPTPLLPTLPEPSRGQPPEVERDLITIAAWNTNASPLGWINDADNETRGNNVVAHLDIDGDNIPDLPRPRGTAGRLFDFPVDLRKPSDTHGPAAVVNAFFWCNLMHDRLWELGFDEASGNFQKDNFGRGGRDGDPVVIEVLDGAGFNNANFTAARDGGSGRIQMYVFNGPNPDRNGAFDADVLLHEYAHGLSDRLMGGGLGLYEAQTYGLSEGWSDFVSLALLAPYDADPDDNFAIGSYVAYALNGNQENYYFGIRRYPYTTDMSRNPLTYRDIDPGQASTHPEVPRNPAAAGSAAEVHRVGEVWCAMLWDMRANLIHRYGSVAGGDLTLRLVIEGLRLTPPYADFIAARDAIIQADILMNGGENWGPIWTAFARRGMGQGARGTDSSTTSGVVESYVVPDALDVTPAVGVTASGLPGGPFQPESSVLTLRNLGSNPLLWTATVDRDWVTVSALVGTLGPGGTQAVTVTLNARAGSLPPGDHRASIVFSNVSARLGMTRTVEVSVGRPAVFVQSFSLHSIGLAGQSITFSPESTGDYYELCRLPVTEFLTPPEEGEILPLRDDAYHRVELAGDRRVSLYGHATNAFYIGSNGDVTLAPGNTNYFEPNELAFFAVPRVAALYADLNPAKGGQVRWQQLSNRVAVSYVGLPEFTRMNSNSFQIELFFDGRIRLTWLEIEARSAIVGLTRGDGRPGPQARYDFSAVSLCAPAFALVLPTRAAEGAGPVAARVVAADPADEPRTVYLTSSRSNLVRVPPSVVLPARAVTANLMVEIAEDDLINGSRVVQVTSSSPGYPSGIWSMTVDDNEANGVTLELTGSLWENAGERVDAGTVRLSRAPDEDVVITLSADQPDRLAVPGQVTMPAHQTLVPIPLRPLDNDRIDGPAFATVTAQVANWGEASAPLKIIDDEVPRLKVEFAARVSEGVSFLEIGTISIPGRLPDDLEVFIESGEPGLLEIISPAIIRAGSTNTTVLALVTDDDLVNGDREVVLTCDADGFQTVRLTVVVVDDELPETPVAPMPADGSTGVPLQPVLSWGETSGSVAGVVHEVRLGLSALLGAADVLTNTGSSAVPAPVLRPSTEYFWQVISTKGSAVSTGAVWHFSTLGVDHFAWDPLPQLNFVNEPLPVRITARDATNGLIPSFTGQVRLSAAASVATASTVLFTEVEIGNDRVELMNVSERSVEISGWQAYVYDRAAWPAPHVRYRFPEDSVVPVGGIFQLRLATAGPNTYPVFTTGTNIGWTVTVTNNPVAIALVNAAGNLVDFFCAVDARPDQIVDPLPIPGTEWSGGAVPPTRLAEWTYQRVRPIDSNVASDWLVVSNTVGRTNAALRIPFTGRTVIGITPEWTGPFSDGVWTGSVQFEETGREVGLVATDPEGRTGESPIFELQARDDLGVRLIPGGEFATAGAAFNLVYVVTNTGPGIAGDVRLAVDLPASAPVRFTATTSGILRTNPGSVEVTVPTLAGGGSFRVFLTVVPSTVGFHALTATVSRSGADGFPPNNVLGTMIEARLPRLTISDVTAAEGNQGSNAVNFPVRLSASCSETVRVDYVTFDDSATVADEDYHPAAGQLEFPPGVTNLLLTVWSFGDGRDEVNERFGVRVSNPVNVDIGRSVAFGAITNDDRPPVMTVGDGVFDESQAPGTIGVSIRLSRPSARTVRVSYQTLDATAVAGRDYEPVAGGLVFPPGITNLEVGIPLRGDQVYSGDRTLTLRLTNAINATLGNSSGKITIVEDDVTAFHRFVWTVPGTTQLVAEPFAASLRAVDATGVTAAGDVGPVKVLAGMNRVVTQVGTDDSAADFPLGAGFHDQRLVALYFAGEIGGAGWLTGLSLDVVRAPGQVLRQFTIRVAPYHDTAFAVFHPEWPAVDWVTVYQADQDRIATGWHTFHFQTPYFIDGRSGLLVDFSFNNDTASFAGESRASEVGRVRGLVQRSDSAFGDPRAWNGRTPPPDGLTWIPNVRLRVEELVGVTPAGPLSLPGGRWDGPVVVQAEHDGLVTLRAIGPDGRADESQVFPVIRPDADRDGLPDDWERAHGLNPESPLDANLDSDRDGLKNIEEFVAGTLPGSAASGVHLSRFELGGGRARIGFHTVQGRRYLLEFAENLKQHWTVVGEEFIGTGGEVLVDDLVTEGRRFYRLRVRR